MTRKLLSGVLAFAMVFGCTAPVALAEETTVEEVEQYANYLPELSETSVKMAKNETKTVKINGINETLTVVIGTYNAPALSCTYDAATQTITLKTDANFNEDSTAGDITIPVTVTGASTDTIVNGNMTLTVKRTATPATVADNVLVDGKAADTKATATLTVGKPVKILFQAGAEGKETAKAKPYSLSYRVTTAGSSFVSVSTADKKNDKGEVIGTEVTLTGLKKTADTDDVRVEFSVKPLSTSTTKVITYTIDVTELKEATALTLKTDKTEITKTTGVANLVAQAYGTDAYGDNMALDGSQNLQWTVNGFAMKDGKVEVKNALDGTIATLNISSTNDGIATFSATETGTYRIAVTDEAGNLSAAKTVTVTNPAMTAIDTLHIAAATDWSVDDKTGGIKVTTPGTTVDLSGIRFAGREDVTGTTKPGHPIADFGIAVTGYAVENAVVDGKVIAGEAVAKKAVSVDAKGLVTVADESNTVMKELLTLAKGKDITFNIIVSFKNAAGKTYSLWDQTPVQVVVTKPSEKAASIELYLDGKKVDTTKSVVLSVGKTYDFDVLVKDAHGYSDAVDQRVVWQIDGNSDKTVYATVDQSGVVTPLQASIESASLKVASITGTTAPVTVKLIIVGEATKPTEKPTEAPTQAPETKTGTVNTSSSALNIRAAASTGATVVAKAAKGSTVTILGEENGFYKVKLADGTVGYASKAYIKVTTDTPVVTITATTTANLKLRTSAPSGSVITVMPKGATVKVIEGGQSWAKVEYNGKVGYASNNYLTFNTVG